MTSGQHRVLYLVVCAAPPASEVGELVDLLHDAGWAVCVVPTPAAGDWVDGRSLADRTGYQVRSAAGRPADTGSLPRADAVLVAPATFNTINKWVAGIADTFALGLLCEALGLDLPVYVVPHVKPTLAAHPAFGRSLRALDDWGVTVLPNETLKPPHGGQPFRWRTVVDALR